MACQAFLPSFCVAQTESDCLPDRHTHVDLHLAVEAVAEHEVVRQLQAVRLHGVARAIVVVAHVAWGC